jgi:putative ABC transport system permease protein
MLSLRTLLRHPIQFVIMTLGIALGVAVMVGIDIANASAERAFDLSASAVTGRATHAIIGSTQDVDESVYVYLRTDPHWRGKLESAPLISAYAVSPQLGEIPFTLLGIDPFAEGPFRSYLGAGPQTQPETLTSLLTVPGAILLSTPTAERYGLQPCPPAALNDASLADSCRLTLAINGETRTAYLTACSNLR